MARAYARADRHVSEREAAAAKARAEYEAFMASQGLEVPPPVAAPTNVREIGAVLKQSFEGFKDAVGETFDDRRDVLDPGEANLNRPGPEVEDEAERADQRCRAGAALRRPRALPRSGAAGDRFHSLRHDRQDPVRGRRRRPAVVRARRAPGAHLRRLPRADPVRPQAPPRGRRAGRVGDRTRAGAARTGRRRRADDRLQAQRSLGGARPGTGVRARRGRRRRVDRAGPGRARGPRRTATARSGSRRRSRTCPARGASCSRPTWRSSVSGRGTPTASR
jgi:hypothetical protein